MMPNKKADGSVATGHGVIVLGVDTQIGLSIVRELGEHGVVVIGIGRNNSAVGLSSRHLSHGYIHSERDDGLIKLILDLARRHDAPYVMTVSEGDILFLNRHREQLADVKLLIPDLGIIETVIDKHRVYKLAESIGMRIPRAVDPNESNGAVPDGMLRFPVVLKWAYPNRAQPLLCERKLAFHKAEYCQNDAELQSALARYAPICYYPLVQEYAAGQGLGHMIYMHQGEPVLRFQHLREHEWPPEGGYSTQCQSLPVEANPELMAQSVALLREVGWDGPAMVEYRFDTATGSAVLMEINGRFWGSLPLAYHSGARFAWLLYILKGRGDEVPPDAGKYRAGVVCRFGLAETKRLLRILFQPAKIQDRSLRFNLAREIASYFAYYFNPSHRYYILSLSDPLPFLKDMVLVLKRMLPSRQP